MLESVHHDAAIGAHVRQFASVGNSKRSARDQFARDDSSHLASTHRHRADQYLQACGRLMLEDAIRRQQPEIQRIFLEPRR